MIPSATTIDRQTNMVAQDTIEMSIDTNSLRFLMNTLSNLYSNRELAVVRELSTNARDAMIAAGRADVPINVKLPNSFRQLLTISDTGIGMDVEDLRNTYSRYGASNKRNSNDFNGVLGLGSKSPFTITDQYTVVAVKDGIMTSVIVSRSPDGGGTMEVISQIPTDKHNGVEIQIPTKRGVDYRNITAEFFKWWAKGTVLIDGVEPKTFTGDKLTDKIYLSYENPYYEVDHIVMGGVAYPLANKISRYYAVIYFADNGEIDFVPSREALDYTTKTQRVIQAVNDEVKANIRADLELKIKDLKSINEAVEFFADRSSLITDLKMNPKFRGYVYPIYSHNVHHQHVYYRGKGWNAERRWSFDIQQLVKNRTNVLIGSTTKLSSTMKQKMAKYAADNNLTNSWILTPTMLNSFWTSELEVVMWDDVKKVKVPGAANVTKGQKRGPVAEYTVFDGSYYFNQNVTLDDTKPIYCVNPTDMDHEGAKLFAKILPADAQIARVYKVKEKAFKKAYPKAIHLHDAGVEHLKAWVAALSTQEYVDYQIYSNTPTLQLLEMLAKHRSQILDPDMFNLYDVVKKGEILHKAFEYADRIYHMIPDHRRPAIGKQLTATAKNGLSGYPYLSLALQAYDTRHLMQMNPQEHVDYINFKYTQNKEKNK